MQNIDASALAAAKAKLDAAEAQREEMLLRHIATVSYTHLTLPTT